MGRTKDKKSNGSPSENSVATNSINRRQQHKTSPDHDNSSRRQQQTMPPKRSLSYDDHDDSDDSKTEASNNGSNHNTFSNKGSNTDLSLNRQQKKMKSNDDKTNLIPEIIRSGDRNDDAISSIMPFSVTNTNKMFADEENSAFPRNLKAMITNTIRTQIFRRIKFLNYEKLSLESNIFKLLFHTTGYHDKHEQQIKYEPLRELVQRQMNSKRNYCTDQILAKARGKNVGLYYVPY